jgi:hypothetical protein
VHLEVFNFNHGIDKINGPDLKRPGPFMCRLR